MKIDKAQLLKDVRESIKLEIDLDGLVLKQLDVIVIPAIDLALAKVAKLIPGPIDDAVIMATKPELYRELKEELQKILVKAEGKIDQVIHGRDV